MTKLTLVDRLMDFSLTRQEATIYQCLITEGKLTGYEVAKCTGISRSNAYSALASLVDKGAAYVSEESAKKYIPLGLNEFCDNYIHHLEKEKQWITEHLPQKKRDDEGYITVDGKNNILNKIRNLIESTQERVYISCDSCYLAEMKELVVGLVKEQKKVVIITDCDMGIEGVTLYLSESKGHQIGIIIDSKYVLSGEYGEGSSNNCLYSGQTNFVEIFKNAMSNEIKLLKIQEGEKQR